MNRLLIILILALYTAFPLPAHADATGTASYYTLASCLAEGTSGIMANGKELDDEGYTCASWDYPFGTVLRVARTDADYFVYVIVTDRGPAKRLYKQGRILDLSLQAMRTLHGTRQGVVPVRIEVIK